MRSTTLAILLSLAAATAAAAPVPTMVTVHVVARDAKAIYQAVGGAHVTITDQRSGKVLASGLHTGKSSGSTEAIMIEPHKRGAAIFGGEDTARFVATIPLDGPTPVEISAEGPAGHPQARASASKSLLLLPGEHITGDGIVLEIHGLIVTAQQPQFVDGNVRVGATVVMACGCPVTPGGIWNANEFNVTARLVGADGAVLAAGPLKFEGGQWTATFDHPAGRPTAVEVIAGHTASANFGMHRLELQ